MLPKYTNFIKKIKISGIRVPLKSKMEGGEHWAGCVVPRRPGPGPVALAGVAPADGCWVDGAAMSWIPGGRRVPFCLRCCCGCGRGLSLAHVWGKGWVSSLALLPLWPVGPAVAAWGPRGGIALRSLLGWLFPGPFADTDDDKDFVRSFWSEPVAASRLWSLGAPSGICEWRKENSGAQGWEAVSLHVGVLSAHAPACWRVSRTPRCV